MAKNLHNPQHDVIDLEIAYATPTKQIIFPIKISFNTTVFTAIKATNITLHFPELIESLLQQTLIIGVFGKKIDPFSYQLRNNDRLEIYRPLLKTPNERRLERTESNESLKK